jgi:hypothetical protein
MQWLQQQHLHLPPETCLDAASFLHQTSVIGYGKFRLPEELQQLLQPSCGLDKMIPDFPLYLFYKSNNIRFNIFSFLVRIS